MGYLIMLFILLFPTLLALIISMAGGLDPTKLACYALVSNAIFIFIFTLWDSARKVNNKWEMNKMIEEQEERKRHENEYGTICIFEKKK